jgi:hypothetical protein
MTLLDWVIAHPEEAFLIWFCLVMGVAHILRRGA